MKRRIFRGEFSIFIARELLGHTFLCGVRAPPAEVGAINVEDGVYKERVKLEQISTSGLSLPPRSHSVAAPSYEKPCFPALFF